MCIRDSLDTWVRGIHVEGLHAGIPQGGGAELAWYRLAVLPERQFARGEEQAFAAVDVRKCFDQLARPLTYLLMLLAGLPAQIMGPYVRMMEGLGVRNGLEESLGQRHSR
eukprot:7754027-Alexandrium_andersonii.AAC.1